MSDDRGQTFEQHRRTLEGLAYRMLGSLAEAHDVVQETYLKWHGADLDTIREPRAWLITVCSRLALNELRSARRRREVYVGEWLPEPFPDGAGGDPEARVELDDSLSMALLLALENLTPAERAAFLLHDVFDLAFDEVSTILGKTNASCRQLARRARQRIRRDRPRFEADPEEHRRLLDGFVAAAQGLDLEGLSALLAKGVELYSDGGGKVEALPERMLGAGPVAKFFVGIFDRFRRQQTRIQVLRQRFNGTLGILVFEDDRLATALTIEVEDRRIHRIFAVRNPDKLGSFAGDSETASEAPPRTGQQFLEELPLSRPREWGPGG